MLPKKTRDAIDRHRQRLLDRHFDPEDEASEERIAAAEDRADHMLRLRQEDEA